MEQLRWRNCKRMELQLTEITNQSGVICKKYNEVNGELQVTPAANVYEATGKTLRLADTDVCGYLDSLSSENSKAIILGVWSGSENWDEFDIVTNSSDKKDPANGVISRTADYFAYANNGSTSLMLLDFDSESSDRDLFIDELEYALSDAILDSDKLKYWSRPSTSASVSINGNVGTGLHVFFPVKNANQKLIELIHRFCWLQSYGGSYKITKSGNVLPESLIDPAVKGPERICYSSDAVIESGPFSRVPRTSRCHDGGVVDCELAISILEDLTVDFKSTWRDRKTNIEKSDEVKQVREAWKRSQVAEKVALGIPEKRAKQETEALANQELLSTDVIYRSDGTEIPVIDVLKTPEDFVGQNKFCDPIKKNFGRNTAMLLQFDGRVVLKSFNHGGVYYWLKWGAEDLAEYVSTLDDDELEDRVGELINNSNLNGIKRKGLIKAIAKRLGVAGGDVDRKSVV